MKKLLVLMTAVVMSLSLAACGGDKKTEPAPAEKPAATAPAEKPAEKPAETAPAEGELEFTLDYDTIASWVDAGFIGTDDTGSPVVMAIDAANENAIIIFGDNSDMTAASFVGPIVYDGDMATISDEANESTLTFSVKQIDELTLELDMGDIGKATIKAADPKDVLSTIKDAIDNYKHIA